MTACSTNTRTTPCWKCRNQVTDLQCLDSMEIHLIAIMKVASLNCIMHLHSIDSKTKYSVGFMDSQIDLLELGD